MTQWMRIDRAMVHAALHGASTTRHLTVSAGAADEAGALFVAAFGTLPAKVIADATTFSIAGARVQRSLQAADVITGEPHVFPEESHLSPDHERIAPLCAAILAAPEGTIPIAVGSGTINDLVKRAAFETNRPYMVVATAASMDGYTASGAALIVDGFKQTMECAAPVAVVADTEILAAAPAQMTAAGYGDLMGKITAGADWLIADALEIEPLIPHVWSMVQDPLRAIVAHPEHLHDPDYAPAAIEQLFLGLVITGLAIQATGSSRPASGSEHQFSHFWEMQGLRHAGQPVSHGFKVALGTLASTLLYEDLLADDPGMHLDDGSINAAVAAWPSLREQEDEVRRTQPTGHMISRALEEVRAKYVSRDELEDRIRLLAGAWPELSERLRNQLIPTHELRYLLASAGCPITPEEIGLTRAELQTSYAAARQIRRRYTVLDLAAETGQLRPGIERLFGKQGGWAADVQDTAGVSP